MITYNWKISTLDRRTSDGFVTTAHWRCDGVDEEFAGSVYATCGWPEGIPETPYEDLTEETVLGWIWTSGVDKDAAEAAVAAQIESQRNPVQATGTPW